MKKLFVILLTLITLTGCGLAPYNSTYITRDDAFKEARSILSTEQVSKFDGKLRFPVISDVHCGREYTDGGIIRFNDNLLKYLEGMHAAGDVVPMFLLGDIIDKEDSNAVKDTIDFIESLHMANPDMEIVYTCGNHELEDSMVEDWEKRFGDLSAKMNNKLRLTGTYTIGDIDEPVLMIYNVNSAYRMYGRHQLNALENALEANKDVNNGLKLITTHIPLSSSKPSQTLMNFVIGDERERNAMLRLMYEYGPTFMLAGHHHKGNTLNIYSDHSAEFIFSAFHRRGEWLESPGRWYIFEIDTATGKCDIFGFSLHTEVKYGLSDDDLLKLAEEHYVVELEKQ